MVRAVKLVLVFFLALSLTACSESSNTSNSNTTTPPVSAAALCMSTEAAAEINERTYICVVMSSSAASRFSDCLTVFREIDPTISLPQELNAAPSWKLGRQAR